MGLKARAIGVAATLALSLTAMAQANEIVNGGFETGDLTGWTVSGDTSFIGVAEGIGHSGDYAAFFGPDPEGSLSQVIATQAGQAYRVTFFVQLDDSAVPNAFSWSWNGAVRALIVDAQGFDYTSTFSGIVVASGPASTLQFTFSNPPSFWLLDDVSVAVVPEPHSAALMLLGLLGVTAARRAARASD